MKGVRKDSSSQPACNIMRVVELRKKIVNFRDILDIPPCNTSVSTDKLLVETMKDLRKFYPESIPRFRMSELKGLPLDKVLIYFCKALQDLGDTSKRRDEWIDKCKYDIYDNEKCKKVDKLVEIAVATINGLIKIAEEKFDMMDEDDEHRDYSPKSKTFGKVLKDSCSENCSSCPSPVTPTSVLPELMNASPKSSYSSSLLWSLRVQAVGKLNPIDVKRFPLHILPKVRVPFPSCLNHKRISVEEQKEEAKGNSPVIKASIVDESRDSTSQNETSEDPLPKVRVPVPSCLNHKKISVEEQKKEAEGNSPVIKASIVDESRDSTSQNETSEDPLPKVRVPVPSCLNHKKISVEEQKLEAKGNSPVIKASIVDETRDSTSQNETSEDPLPKVRVPVPSCLNHKKISVEEQKEEAKGNSPVIKASIVDETRDSTSQNETSEDPLSNSNNASGDRATDESNTALSKFSPSVAPIPPSSPSMMQSPESSIDMKVAAEKSPSPPATPKEVSPPPSPSQGAKLSTDRETDIRLLPPAAELLSPPPLSQPTKLSTDMEIDIRPLPSPPPPPSPFLQPNIVPRGPPLPPLSPPMLQPNVEAAQPTLVATELQLHTTAIGIPLPPPPPPPVPLKSTEVAIGAPFLPAPPVPLQSKEASTGAPLPPTSPPTPGRASGIPPPPPPVMLSKGSGPLPPPPMSLANGAAPPPPPPGPAKSLSPKKPDTKLKRSSHVGNLYRVLKGKVEGSPVQGKSSNGKKSGVGSEPSGKRGMADALAEMTKRSAYFQQIEQDVEKYAKSITELKTTISTFNTKDMTELLKFHKHVESILENLTDETQVLARFEGFPTKKLEALRTASALYSKLESMITELRNWKIEPPLPQLLDKVERYFNKIKGDLDAMERTKDEESIKFNSHNIDFDFQVLVRIKEAMVDVSSNCMELAMKERREVNLGGKEVSKTKAEAQKKVCTKMLWRAFQFAFRVYTFAGGHDDRADKLTQELAHEIENDPQHP
ncbi:hypothetical protein REPUB_Repub14bG0129600 [Reevesia pubescens]